MRRAIPVIVTTAGGLALVAGFHTNPRTSLAAGPGPSPTSTTPPTEPRTTSTLRAAAPTTTAAPAVRSIVGPLIETEYGAVQVRVTMTGARITDVEALQLPSDRSRSVSISQYAGPRLRLEALRAQSANIDLISGASYTSQGYADSLQGALDRAAGR
jgi:uncharacterized protein with FMN-binding domain